MSLYKPAKSRFYQFDFQFQGRRYHGSTGCTSKRDAERFEAEERRKAALGEKSKPAITLEKACDLWFDRVGKFHKNHYTELYQLGNLVRGLGRNVMLHDITVTAMDDYIARRRADVKNASVNRETTLLRRVVNWCADRHEVPAINWKKLILPEPVERERELTAEEERRLFEHLPDSLKPLVEFAILSGQRRSELIAMRWVDVDFKEARAKVWAKGGKPHSFPLTPRMVAIIKAQPKGCPQVFTYVAERDSPPRDDRPRRIKGERYPFSKLGWARKWKKALKDAGIDNYRFHDNRHTAGTRNLRASGNLRGVQKLLGHKDIKTTARYAHALEEDVRAMLAATESRNSPEPENETPEKARKSANDAA